MDKRIIQLYLCGRLFKTQMMHNMKHLEHTAEQDKGRIAELIQVFRNYVIREQITM